MLSSTDFPISNAVQLLATYGLQAAYLVPTETGLEKSILDAHGSLRDYLFEAGIHDFSVQGQGPEHKRQLVISIFDANSKYSEKLSLYRPQTKHGDPRIWVTGLKQHCKAGNLLAIICTPSSELLLINISDSAFRSSLGDPRSPFRVAISSGSMIEDSFKSLLAKLEDISAQGFIPSKRAGATGVGYTLETLLGISANSSKNPDYRGIEIKTGRKFLDSKSQKTRTSLFSQVPDWKSSPIKNGRAILDRAGNVDPATSRLQLYCTNSRFPNSQGLFLVLDEEEEWLESRIQRPSGDSELMTRWSMRVLRDRLATKHASTFWVEAETRKNGGIEEFHYSRVTHTQKPLIWNLGPAIQAGAVTMDYTLSLKPSGLTRDHGYLFKIHETNLDLLFPPNQKYDLAAT